MTVTQLVVDNKRRRSIGHEIFYLSSSEWQWRHLPYPIQDCRNKKPIDWEAKSFMALQCLLSAVPRLLVELQNGIVTTETDLTSDFAFIVTYFERCPSASKFLDSEQTTPPGLFDIQPQCKRATKFILEVLITTKLQSFAVSHQIQTTVPYP
ncbi:hypothetical protein BDD12DRAFT_215736 [Trichophaea hybrida]|nr:hypothetical protein BDD12DRAFT_215736 [Trichophaea hybrida]